MHTASKVYYVLTAYRFVRIFLNNRHINAEFNIWSILKIPQCSQTEVESCASKKNFLPTALLTAQSRVMILVIGLRNQKVVVPKSDEPSAFLMLIFLAPLPTSTINNYRKKFLVTFIIIQHILMQSLVTLQFRQKLFKQGYIPFHQNGKDHQNNM